MNAEVELVGFESYEQARVAAQKLQAANIPCRVSHGSGMFTAMHVAPEDVERVTELIGAEGIELIPLQEVEESKESTELSGDEKQTFESNRDRLVRQVSSELKAAEEKKNKPLQQIITLIITIFLFASMGLFEGSVSGILILVGVIFIHEMGHLISMRLLKYKDVQMFFIPLFGAAVSGRDTAPSGTKKAIVSLMGPVPGILLGIVTRDFPGT